MTRKPRLLLLDAGAVIAAFACGGWDALCQHYEIVIPAIVIDEAHFFTDGEGNRNPIDLEPYLSSGAVTRFEADVLELAETSRRLHPTLRTRIHAGEQEALTYLRVEGTDGVGFVSADGAAIEATHAFDAADCALSLDHVLRRCGVTKALEERHTDGFVKRHLDEGGRLLVQGLLLA